MTPEFAQPYVERDNPYHEVAMLATEDMESLGINPYFVSSIEFAYFPEGVVPSAYNVKMQTERGDTMEARMIYEIGYEDKKSRVWDGRIFVLPRSAHSNGQEVNLPSMYSQTDGYQILVKRNPNFSPFVRIDSLCKTSMVDGHRSSGGDEGLGCDCAEQRSIALSMIYQNGGLSVLTPAEGRANGIEVHAQQIAIQNFSRRHNIPVPDTYKAVEALGHPADRRSEFYFLDALILRLFGMGDKNIILLTNNPEKVQAVRMGGINAEVRQLIDVAHIDYYHGVNGVAKAGNGHSLPSDTD